MPNRFTKFLNFFPPKSVLPFILFISVAGTLLLKSKMRGHPGASFSFSLQCLIHQLTRGQATITSLRNCRSLLINLHAPMLPDIVVVLCCYVNITPKLSSLKQQICQFHISQGRSGWPGSGPLTRLQSRFRPVAMVTWGLAGAGRSISKTAQSPSVGRRPQFLIVNWEKASVSYQEGLSRGLLECLHNITTSQHVSHPPQSEGSEREREQGRKRDAFMTESQQFLYVPSLSPYSICEINPAHIQRGENKYHRWKGEISRIKVVF